MIYKKRMHRAIQLFLCLLLNHAAVATDLASSSENANKRFNLQDLLGQGLQPLTTVNGNQVPSTTSAGENQLASPKTQTIDVGELLAAAQKAAANQQEQAKQAHEEDIVSKFTETKKPVDIDISADKNGNLNLEDIPGIMSSNSPVTSVTNSNPGISVPISDLQSLIKGKQASLESPVASIAQPTVVKEELDLGKQKLEIESAGKRATRYTLARGPDGGLNLVPTIEETPSNRQQMQMTTLSQALYSPFPSEQNILHLHLKGKDGKDGKSGNKGSSGPIGPKGPDGPRGAKGDAGTCSSQINGLFECTPDELDSLSNRVDYLEKICKKRAPPPPFKPIGKIGTEGNPLPSCQAIFEKNPNSKSGSFWLMTNGVRYKTHCDFDQAIRRGWTLVARVNGTGNDFTAVSNAWADDSVFNQETADDISLGTPMKNHGWFLQKANAIKVCFHGASKDCAVFSHNLGMRLAELFSQEYGVIVEQKWTFDRLLQTFGKTCDTSKIRKEWCGLNLANICHPEDMNPNLNPTNHIVRIGCIGALSWTCTPGDFAIGIGVTSCYDGYGCERVGPRTPSMHWSCPPNYGAFPQTGFIYIS